MNIIKLLDNMEVGTPLIVTTKWQNITIRKITLYAGNNEIGKYNFIDDTGHYIMTPGYIRDHVTIQTELDQDEDLWELSKLLRKIKEVK